jgi:hypothetical protein
MKLRYRNMLAAALAVVLGGMLAFAKSNPQQERSQSTSTDAIATANCNDTFESTGVGNSTSVKGAAEEAQELALAGAQVLCPAECPAALVKSVSIRTEKIITKVKGMDVVTFRVTFTGQYTCKGSSS